MFYGGHENGNFWSGRDTTLCVFQVYHGVGSTTEESNDSAAQMALTALAQSGLDVAQPKDVVVEDKGKRPSKKKAAGSNSS